jgi:hypothetical protein
MDMSGAATSEHFLVQVSRLIDWPALDPVIRAIGDRIYADVPPAAVRMLLLARWYGLTEAALLEACQDRLSFRRFLDLPLDDATGDASLAEIYRREVSQAPVEAQTFIHAIESQLLTSGVFIRPGVFAEAAIVRIPSDAIPSGPATGTSTGTGTDATEVPPLFETALFQPDEMADLLKHGEAAFVRGGALMATSTNPPHRPTPAELVSPEQPAAPIQVVSEWPWGHTLELTAPLDIGREHRFCTFAPELQPYLHVSRRHAQLTPCPEGVWVRDLKSRNGTFVNDEELPKGQAYLVDSDATIRFGPHCVLQLKIKRS